MIEKRSRQCGHDRPDRCCWGSRLGRGSVRTPRAPAWRRAWRVTATHKRCVFVDTSAVTCYPEIIDDAQTDFCKDGPPAWGHLPGNTIENMAMPDDFGRTRGSVCTHEKRTIGGARGLHMAAGTYRSTGTRARGERVRKRRQAFAMWRQSSHYHAHTREDAAQVQVPLESPQSGSGLASYTYLSPVQNQGSDGTSPGEAVRSPTLKGYTVEIPARPASCQLPP